MVNAKRPLFGGGVQGGDFAEGNESIIGIVSKYVELVDYTYNILTYVEIIRDNER